MLPITSRWLSSSVAISNSMSLRPASLSAKSLGEIAHGGGKLALRPAELLEQQVGKHGIGF